MLSLKFWINFELKKLWRLFNRRQRPQKTTDLLPTGRPEEQQLPHHNPNEPADRCYSTNNHSDGHLSHSAVLAGSEVYFTSFHDSGSHKVFTVDWFNFQNLHPSSICASLVLFQSHLAAICTGYHKQYILQDFRRHGYTETTLMCVQRELISRCICQPGLVSNPREWDNTSDVL